MTLFKANVRIVARIRGGLNPGEDYPITVANKGGDPTQHMGVPLLEERKMFVELERVITIDIAGAPPGYTPDGYDCYGPARKHLESTLPRQFGLEGNNQFAQGHAWVDGHWVRTGAQAFGYGYLVTKLDELTSLYKPYKESIKWGSGQTLVTLTLDWVLSVSGTA